MRFRWLGLLALTASSCAGLTFRAEPARDGFRAAEMVDAVAFGAIPPLDRPRHASGRDLEPGATEPLAVVEAGEQVRAYPLSILIWHEAVNDTVGGVPVLVTYSPLTDTVAAWVRRDGTDLLTFEPSGKIYAGAGVLTDRESRSLWLPPTGRAVAGPRTGAQLAEIPVLVLPASAYLAAVPDGTVMDPETGFTRPYGRSPYRGYDRRERPPSRLFLRSPDPRLFAMSRVLAVPGGAVYPFDTVRRQRVINDGDAVIVWVPGVASVLDREVVARSRDAGSAVAFIARLDGRRLTFVPAGDALQDRETRSRWNVMGRAVSGPLAGRRLQPFAAIRSLWFAWAAIARDARVYDPRPGG